MFQRLISALVVGLTLAAFVVAPLVGGDKDKDGLKEKDKAEKDKSTTKDKAPKDKTGVDKDAPRDKDIPKGLRDKDTIRDKDNIKDVTKDKSDKNKHIGIFLSATGDMFTMESKGKEHMHTLAPKAKVLGSDGKTGSLEGLSKGQLIRVITEEGNPNRAIRVEVIAKKEKDGGTKAKESPER